MIRIIFVALLLVFGSTMTSPAKELRIADSIALTSMEPYFGLLSQVYFLANIYEPLVKLDSNGQLVGVLATEWKQTSPTTWVFTLRRGVTFQEGQPFTADDVVFSLERARKPTSSFPQAKSLKAIRKIDDFTVEIELPGPNQVVIRELGVILMMSKEWATRNNSEAPADRAASATNFASRNTNGTGPFKLVRWDPNVSVELAPNENWWGGKRKDSLTSAKYFVIENTATQVAALIAGNVDLIMNLTPSAIDRLQSAPGVKVVQSRDVRTPILGFDVRRDQLLDPGVKGNPFKDKRVRQAVYYAIDVSAIVDKVMRGYAVPIDLIGARPETYGYDEALSQRLPYDVKKAKALMAEAGYENGFEVPFECSTGYIVNDQALCQAISAMLAQIGIKVRLALMPTAPYLTKIQGAAQEGTFFLYSWVSSGFDSGQTFKNLFHTRDSAAQLGLANVTGWSNAEFDKLTEASLAEMDPAKRLDQLKAAWRIVREERPMIPLYQLMVIWSSRDSVSVVPDPLNRLFLQDVTLN